MTWESQPISFPPFWVSNNIWWAGSPHASASSHLSTPALLIKYNSYLPKKKHTHTPILLCKKNASYDMAKVTRFVGMWFFIFGFILKSWNRYYFIWWLNYSHTHVTSYIYTYLKENMSIFSTYYNWPGLYHTANEQPFNLLNK